MIYWVINYQNILHCRVLKPHYLSLLKADIEWLVLCLNYTQNFSPAAGIYWSQNLQYLLSVYPLSSVSILNEN